jgi:cytidylate kinase
VANEYGIDVEEAKRHVIRTEANRKSFVRKYFYTDIADPLNYNLVINMDRMSIDRALNCIGSMIGEYPWAEN